MPVRRFPPPRSVEEQDACFVVRDQNGHQQLAYVYFENEPGRRSAAKLLTKDEARRIAGQYRKAAGAVGAGNGCLCVFCSSVWQRRNRASVTICARSYSVTADVRLVFFDDVQKRSRSAVFVFDEATNGVDRITERILPSGPSRLT
jgi:hypothetical protein